MSLNGPIPARPPLTVLAVSACAACLAGPTPPGQSPNNPSFDVTECSIPQTLIFDGGPGKDGIPALTNPTLVAPGASGTEYLQDADRVIGLVVEGQPVAVPLRIGWWHEIVNLDLGGKRVAVTHCPLTGSSLVFDRRSAGNNTFGVSGLLFMNNLIMYDRSAEESLWPQLSRGARCGARRGTNATMIPSFEMTWGGWKALYPDTRVVSSKTDIPRNYSYYPYGDYDRPDNPDLLFPMPGGLDRRRPPKERVLAIPLGDSAGVAFPFGALQALGNLAVVNTSVGNQPIVVFWAAASGAAAAFSATSGGAKRTFRVQSDQIVDDESGSSWRVDGLATSGPLAGTRLDPVAEAFVVYWFAWPAFYPAGELWTPAQAAPPRQEAAP